MKKILAVFILFLMASLSLAQQGNIPGVRVNIELVTGAKQTAQFLGISQDTVSLGGVIQGKFTVVRIMKDRFKSIIDENGNNLLNGPATSQPAAANTTQVASSKDAVVADPSQEIIGDSSAEETVHIPTILDSIRDKHVFIAMERRSIDSSLAEQLSTVIIRMLQEAGTSVVVLKRTDFGYCRENTCIKDSLSLYGARTAYFGRIVAAQSTDSLTIQAYRQSITDTTISSTDIVQMNLSVFKSVSDAISSNKLNNFVKQLQGKPLPPPEAKKSYIHVETDPEGATISTPSRGDICKTPCTFATKDTGKTTIYAYWNVDQQLWGASSVVNPIGSDSLKISLKLKPVRPELRVITIPSDAEIYAGSAPLTIKSKPIGYSPNKYPIYEPGSSTIQLRKAGYRDTMLTVYVPPTELTDINVELEPIKNMDELHLQEEWIHQRKISTIGKTLMGASIAPIIVGALFTYLANQDYDDADKIKQDLQRPASTAGSAYQKKVKENHDLVHKGERKMIIGGSLIGTGIIMLGVGFVLAF